MTVPAVTLTPTVSEMTSTVTRTIPVIDMNDWYAQETSRRKNFVKGLDDAFRTVGFVAVINPNLPKDILDAAYKQVEVFYGTSQANKDKLYNPQLSGQRGYRLGETAKGKENKDQKEFLHVGREYSQEAQYERLKIAKNIWGDELELQKTLTALYTALEKYMDPFLEAIAEAMNQPADFLKNMTHEGDCLLRSLHYFPALEGTIVGEEHTDIDIIAVIPKATCEGLQVDINGEWVDAKVPEGAFIINAGDMLESMTNGYYKSARHRIVAPHGFKERYSMVHFVHPRGDDPVGPLEAFIKITGGVQKHPEGTRNARLFERLTELQLATKEMAEQLVKSGLLQRRIDLGKPNMDCIKRLQEMGVSCKLNFN